MTRLESYALFKLLFNGYFEEQDQIENFRTTNFHLVSLNCSVKDKTRVKNSNQVMLYSRNSTVDDKTRALHSI